MADRRANGTKPGSPLPRLEPIEDHLRRQEPPADDSELVVRGSPLDAHGLKRNAQRTSQRYSFSGLPLVAISAELTSAGWGLDKLLAGHRLENRATYGAVTVAQVLEGGFGLLATFDAPHFSVIWRSYTDEQAALLSALFGHPRRNPHYRRRQR